MLVTHSGKIDMADHPHDVCNLISSDDTASLALDADLPRDIVLISFEDGGLMKTDGGSVDVHVDKNDVGIVNSSRKP